MSEVDERAIDAEVATNWQPIETAPRDRTRILLYFPQVPEHYDQRSKITVGCRVDRGWWVSALGAGGLYEDSSGEIHPSHWHPLPDPPTEEK